MGQQFEGKENYVQNLFNSIASNYDRMNLVMTGGLLKYWHKVFVNKADFQKGQRALDICCGTGDLTFLLANQLQGEGEVIGLDFAQSMLEVANQRKSKSSLSNLVSFIQGNALALPFQENQFNITSIGFAMRNVSDISLAVKEMTRVTKPGGKVMCLEVSKPMNPLLRWGFEIYFYKIVPLIGRVVDKGKAIEGKYPAYTWLPQSLVNFPSQEKLAQIFRGAGLKDVRYYCLSGGAVTLHVGVK